MNEPVETETAPAHGDGRRKLNQELDRPGKIMVSGIPKREDYMEAELEREFAPFGRITEVNIIRDRRTNLPRGFAFITYENPQDSEDAIKAMEGKDFGGEAPVHCEQAVIGLKRRLMTEDGRGGRGARGGRFMDRGGRGRGMMDRGRGRGEGRGMIMDRGRGMMTRGRGMMERGRGMMERGRGIRGRGGRFDDGQIYQEEEYYEEYYNGEPEYQGFPPRGRGIPPPRGAPPSRGIRARGAPPGRGMPANHGAPPPRGSSGRKVLLPSPPVQGSRGPFAGPGRMPPREEHYGEEADGYGEGDYYAGQEASGYTEGYEEPYAEEGDYGAEEYYRERPAPVRRGTAIARGRGGVARGRPEPAARQLDEYGYPIEEASVVPRTTRPPAAAPRRRAVPAYSEEMLEEEVDPYSTGRGRAPPVAGQSSLADPGVWGYADGVLDRPPGARPVRPVAAGRGAAAAAANRRTALLGPDPYQEEAKGYERARPMTGAAESMRGYGDDPYADPYKRKVAPAAARQPAGARARPAMLSSEDMYATDRIPAKGVQSMNEPMAARRAVAASRFADDYQSSVPSGMSARDAYGEMRRPVARRETDYHAREDPYNRVAAETDAYVSYASASKMTAESMASDPYSRKRTMDMYDDGTEMVRSSAGVGGPRRDYDDYRPTAPAAPPVKRERMDRTMDRSVYEAYSSRQEGAYRGL